MGRCDGSGCNENAVVEPGVAARSEDQYRMKLENSVSQRHNRARESCRKCEKCVQNMQSSDEMCCWRELMGDEAELRFAVTPQERGGMQRG